MTRSRTLSAAILPFALVAGGVSSLAVAPAAAVNPDPAAFWTHARIASAKSLDFVFAPGAAVADQVVADAGIDPMSTNLTQGASWTDGGLPLAAVGKVFFALGKSLYVCSAAVVADSNASRSIVLSAGHCAWDGRKYATNWTFIPAYDTTPNASCADKTGANKFTYGCWTATSLVLHRGFTGQRKFTTTATQYDWSFAVMGAGGNTGTQLDATVGSFALDVNGFTAVGNQAYSFGYPQAAPYNGKDLIYSAGPLSVDPYNGLTWGMGSSQTGGSSGGPWMSNFNASTLVGKLSSVNSYKYTNDSAHMYGPKFNANTQTTYNAALTATSNTIVG